MHVCEVSYFSHVRLFVTPWTVACQSPLSMGFSRQEYWSGLSCPPPGESSWPKDQTHVSCVSCIAGRFFTHWATWEACFTTNLWQKSSHFKTSGSFFSEKEQLSRYLSWSPFLIQDVGPMRSGLSLQRMESLPYIKGKKGSILLKIEHLKGPSWPE